jgi:hypothetical protein
VAVVNENGTMTEAGDYVRELSDAELVALAQKVGQRTQALVSQGVPIPIHSVESHHLIGLLESFVGPEESLTVREWHLTWLDRQLDEVERQMRVNLIESGIFEKNGST